MSGDYSRDSFDALRDFAGVFLQQGRAVLDADWNEMVEVFERRIRAGTVDTIGRCVVPRETLTGFEIQLDGAGSFSIGRGRMYLDGMLLECHGLADFDNSIADPNVPDPVFDRGREVETGPEGVLDEMISPPEGDFLPYDLQPYWPTPEALPGEEGTHLAYVVAWQREVTPVKNPALLEPALGGIDTTTRWQTVWQVRMLADVGDNATCATPAADLNGWIAEVAPSTARLTTDTIDIDDPEDPCLVPPTDGYSGLENQLYRVELHTAGDAQGDARFKFSRENASVSAPVESIANANDRVTVGRIGRDEVLRFRAGDWVEITDDHREFNHRSGRMLRVAVVNEETREIEFEEAIDSVPGNDDLIPTGVGDDTVTARRTRLIRWDQRGIIRETDGTEWVNLDLANSDGLIPVPPDDRALVLESGITVSFSTADGPGRFREMDYWRFAARTAGTQIEELQAAPPDGIQRHHCRLAIVRFPASRDDCRVFWPPEFHGGESCACTVCVTAEGHNSGTLTIQAAIDQIPEGGGTVCLEAGIYVLDSQIVIDSRIAIKVVGQGIGTLLVYRGAGAAIRVENGIDIQLERFSLFVIPAADDDVGGIPPTHGITGQNAALLALRRLAVIVLSANPEDRFDFAIALDGTQIATKIEECVALAPIALGSRSSFDTDQEEEDDPVFVAFAEFRVLDCILMGGRTAVRFERVALNVAEALMERNLIFGDGGGIQINWVEIPAASTSISSSTVLSNRIAILSGAVDIRIQDSEISGGGGFGDGIRLVDNIVPELETDAQIIGNSIIDLADAGLRLTGHHDTLFVKRNKFRRCGEAGVVTEAEAEIRHIAIDNNTFQDIADDSDEGGAGAIVLTGAGSGQIQGNVVQGVGQAGQDGEIYAGIAVQGSGALSITGNTVSEIGPDLPETRAIGILVRPPDLAVTVGDNNIVGTLAAGGDSSANWIAIEIGVPGLAGTIGGDTGPGAVVNGFAAAVPGMTGNELAYVVFNNVVFHLTATRLVVGALSRAGHIGVSGNQIMQGMRTREPMVQIADPAAVSLNFSQNQCSLTGGGGISSVVLLGARRMTVNANSIVHNTDANSLIMTTGGGGTATPIGNITTAGIVLNGAALQPPFAALNTHA